MVTYKDITAALAVGLGEFWWINPCVHGGKKQFYKQVSFRDENLSFVSKLSQQRLKVWYFAILWLNYNLQNALTYTIWMAYHSLSLANHSIALTVLEDSRRYSEDISGIYLWNILFWISSCWWSNRRPINCVRQWTTLDCENIYDSKLKLNFYLVFALTCDLNGIKISHMVLESPHAAGKARVGTALL